jgi:TfoX/Sxy family transcriptional regulator of competence genes
MKWRKAPEALVQKFDILVPHDPRIERRKMFGYPAAFVGGNLFMGLYQDSLMLRLSEEDRAEFLTLQGAALFEPMPGRPLRGYVTVPPAMLRQDGPLSGWIARSLRYARSIPAKGPRAKGAAEKVQRTGSSGKKTGERRRGRSARTAKTRR